MQKRKATGALQISCEKAQLGKTEDRYSDQEATDKPRKIFRVPITGRLSAMFTLQLHSAGSRNEHRAKENGPEQWSSGPFVLAFAYAAICFAIGAAVLISIFRGNAATAIGAVISSTPFTYSAVNFSTITPSGSVSVLSNTP